MSKWEDILVTALVAGMFWGVIGYVALAFPLYWLWDGFNPTSSGQAIIVIACCGVVGAVATPAWFSRQRS